MKYSINHKEYPGMNAPQYLIDAGIVFVPASTIDDPFWQGLVNRPEEVRPMEIVASKHYRRGASKSHRSKAPKGAKIE
jgi:hypothetical protein